MLGHLYIEEYEVPLQFNLRNIYDIYGGVYSYMVGYCYHEDYKQYYTCNAL